MDHASFMQSLTRPLYVWRMAHGNLNSRMLRSRETRMANAQREIDRLVLNRAVAILRENGYDDLAQQVRDEENI